ncbi:hypothetical protein [Bacillus sp. MMSF_3328]|uniref:hypothetical protein n=1 Tax=Bacillus sp. MMSF_3328 TaxID=3047080 RepID=UPI00273DE087|nr:hypothetical protein [Bacillus sp. MMSF_3328]
MKIVAPAGGAGTTILKKIKIVAPAGGAGTTILKKIKIVAPATGAGTTILKKNENSGSSHRSWDHYPEEKWK